MSFHFHPLIFTALWYLHVYRSSKLAYYGTSLVRASTRNIDAGRWLTIHQVGENGRVNEPPASEDIQL